MKSYYFAPSGTLAATPPRGAWHAMPCPGDVTWSLCAVERWADDTADDDWEALPGVRRIYPEDLPRPLPAAVVAALAPLGVTAIDTGRQAFEKIRRVWSHTRH